MYYNIHARLVETIHHRSRIVNLYTSTHIQLYVTYKMK